MRKLRLGEPEVTQIVGEQGKNTGLLTSNHFLTALWLLLNFKKKKALSIKVLVLKELMDNAQRTKPHITGIPRVREPRGNRTVSA